MAVEESSLSGYFGSVLIVVMSGVRMDAVTDRNDVLMNSAPGNLN